MIICLFIIYILWFCRNSFWCCNFKIFILQAGWSADTCMQNRSLLQNQLIMCRYHWICYVFHLSFCHILLFCLLCHIYFIIQFSLLIRLLFFWLTKKISHFMNIMLFIIWFNIILNFSLSFIHISFLLQQLLYLCDSILNHLLKSQDHD